MEKNQFYQNTSSVRFLKFDVDLINYFTAKCELFLRRYRTRQQMMHLTPEQLSDVGISQAQLEEELQKPFWK
ncbi:MAG: DUF1127 domain-containing protein [Arenicella sp.]